MFVHMYLYLYWGCVCVCGFICWGGLGKTVIWGRGCLVFDQVLDQSLFSLPFLKEWDPNALGFDFFKLKH